MSAPTPARLSASPLQALLHDIPRWLLAAIPLAALQPVFSHIASHVARTRPELFARLGPHTGKHFLIDPIDLPFVLVLRPDAARPHLRAYRRSERPRNDAAIAGTFFNLMDMIDGTVDGDALFFSRDLRVTGDIDDFEGSALDSVIASFGPLSKPAVLALSALRALRSERPT